MSRDRWGSVFGLGLASWRQRAISWLALALALLAAAGTGCQRATPGPTVTSTAMPSPSPTVPMPSATSTWTVAPEPTATAFPSATPTLASTATPTPTEIPWTEIPVYGGNVTALIVAPEDPLVLYAGTESAGVFRSDDAAASWSAAREGLPAAGVTQLLAHPARPGAVYAALGGSGVWETTDSGLSWTPTGAGLPAGYRVTSLIAPGNADRLYAGLLGGDGGEQGMVCVRQAPGQAWDCHPVTSSGSDGSGSGVLSLRADAGPPTKLYAGTLADGVLQSNDLGRTWTTHSDGLPRLPGAETRYEPVTALAAIPGDARGGLAAVVGGEYYTWDLGWRLASQNHPVLGEALLTTPSRPETIYSAGGLNGYAYVSQDAGLHWERMLGPPNWGRVSAIAAHPDQPDRLYVAASPWPKGLGGVLVSDDSGESWALSSVGITAVSVTSLACDPWDADRVLLGTASGHVLRSPDRGGRWDRIYLRGSPVTDIAFDPQQSGRAYALAGDLFVSDDGGQSFAKEPAVRFGNGMAIDAANGDLYVGSAEGRGVFAGRDGGASWGVLDAGLPPYGARTCPVLCLAIDGRPGGVWVGMQYGCGLAYSQDGGRLWRQMAFPGAQSVAALGVSADGLLLAGVREPADRLYASQDGGLTWALSWEGSSPVVSIRCDDGSGICYMGTEGSGLYLLAPAADWVRLDAGLFSNRVQALALRGDAGSDQDLLVGTDAGLQAISLVQAP